MVNDDYNEISKYSLVVQVMQSHSKQKWKVITQIIVCCLHSSWWYVTLVVVVHWMLIKSREWECTQDDVWKAATNQMSQN